MMAVALLILSCIPASPSMADPLRAQKVKAAFVLNIARFVYWPDEAFEAHPDTIHLCLYRANPFGDAIESIRNKRVSGRRLDIRRIQPDSGLDKCNILFVPRQYRAEIPEQGPPQSSGPAALLTITDLTQEPEGATGSGNTLIALVRERNRIGFEIDLGKVRRSGLRMSSELLKLGNIVGD